MHRATCGPRQHLSLVKEVDALSDHAPFVNSVFMKVCMGFTPFSPSTQCMPNINSILADFSETHTCIYYLTAIHTSSSSIKNNLS